MTDKPKVGRPTKMTSEILNKLEEAFIDDLTDQEACIYAGISHTTFYNYQKDNPEFIERKEQLRGALGIKAKENIAKAIRKGDKKTSKWWLSRKRKGEFSTRTELTGDEGKPIEVADVTAEDEKIIQRYYKRYHKETDNGGKEERPHGE